MYLQQSNAFGAVSLPKRPFFPSRNGINHNSATFGAKSQEGFDKIELSTGTLQVTPKKDLEQFIDWGSRINKKRGFLFVSKVLGKHIPVPPQKMEKLYVKMANQLRPLIRHEPTLVIGMAETATALGNGVFEKIRQFSPNSIFMHTTRYNLSKPRMLNFTEDHCHAPSHILYQPQDVKTAEKLKNIQNIVIVDDEISTGNTLVNFSRQLRNLKASGVLPNLKPDGILASTILQWNASKKVLSDASIKTAALCKGDFKFESRLTDQTPMPSVKSVTTNPDFLDTEIPHNFGRFGIDGIKLDFKTLFPTDELQKLKGKKVLVLGTGEFMYPAYLVGKHLKANGVNSFVQATTRSPINKEGAIHSKIGFQDNYHEDIDNFLYNIKDGYDKILVCYETPQLPGKHKQELFEQLKTYCKDVQPLFIEPK